MLFSGKKFNNIHVIPFCNKTISFGCFCVVASVADNGGSLEYCKRVSFNPVLSCLVFRLQAQQ